MGDAFVVARRGVVEPRELPESGGLTGVALGPGGVEADASLAVLEGLLVLVGGEVSGGTVGVEDVVGAVEIDS